MEFLIPIVAIVFGTTFAAFIFYQIFSLIKTWINRHKSAYDEDSFERMAQAFIKHKENTERRLQHIEAIVTDDEPASSAKELNRPSSKTIEIKEDHKKNRTQSDSQNLRNMLKE